MLYDEKHNWGNMTHVKSLEALTSLAMLKVDRERGHDYLDYVIPFVVNALERHRSEPVHISDTQSALDAEFGLQLPRHIVERLLRRLAKSGILRREDGLYWIGDIPRNGFAARRSNIREQYQYLIKDLREWVHREYSRELDDNQATDALVAYLSQFSVECLRAYETGCALPAVPPNAPELQFLISSYVEALAKHDNVKFEAFMDLVRGHMLANALICSDLERSKQKFRRVRFYLDTPFLIRMLGLEGTRHEEAAQELLHLVRRLEGKFYVFEHTIEELGSVLRWQISNFGNHRQTSEILQHFRFTNRSRSDLELTLLKLPLLLEELEIERHGRGIYVDESLTGTIDSAILSHINYKSHNTLAADTKSVLSILAIRDQDVPRSLEEAMAVLVTSNEKFARAIDEYNRHKFGEMTISPVITDFSLANVAWLKAPMQAPNLPTLEVLAACYAAIHPSPELWSAYLREVDHLVETGKVSVEDHALLRMSSTSSDDLMNLTLGSEDVFTAETVREMLERAKSRIQAPLKQELDDEKQDHKATRLNANLVGRRLRAGKASLARFAKAVGNGVAGLAVAILLAGYGAFAAFGLRRSWLYVLTIVVPAMGLILANILVGFTLKSAFLQLRDRIAQSAYGFLENAVFSLDGTGESADLDETSAHLDPHFGSRSN